VVETRKGREFLNSKIAVKVGLHESEEFEV
jgi:hypothetical protein